jgi:hypothetical protein
MGSGFEVLRQIPRIWKLKQPGGENRWAAFFFPEVALDLISLRNLCVPLRLSGEKPGKAAATPRRRRFRRELN